MQKLIHTLLITCAIVTIANSQARRIVIEMDHAEYTPLLSDKEISIIGNNLTQLLREYIEYSSFQNEQGTFSNENTKEFLNLFESDALVYSDLHLSYKELYIDEYVNIVETDFSDYGLDATIDYAGLISLQPSAVKTEFVAHLAIDKVNYSKIAINGERIFFEDGQLVKFDMYVQINLAKNSYKISYITNDEAKPTQQIVAQNVIQEISIKEPVYAHVQVEQRQLIPNAFDAPTQSIRLSVGSILGRQFTTPDYSTAVSSSIDLSAMLYRPITTNGNTSLTLGFSMHQINMETSITKGGISLINNDPISYISTSRGHILESNEETNLTKISIEDGEISEQLSYKKVLLSIGLAQKIYSKKLTVSVGAEVIPARILFKDGQRESYNMSAYKLPDNVYFPSMDVIKMIQPDVLNHSSYSIAENENTELYDADRFEISGGAHVMLEYQLLNRISISTKLSKRITIWNQKNNLLDNQLTPVIYSTQEPLKINSMLIDLGIIFKY